MIAALLALEVAFCLTMLRRRKEAGWKKKIALLMAVVAGFGVGISFPSDAQVVNAVGTYNTTTGEIWVSEDLPPKEREMVMTHELAHAAFFSCLPFWSTIGKMLAVIIAYTAGLAMLTGNLYYIGLGFVGYIVAELPEVHAYSVQFLAHGFNTLTAGLFVVLVMPSLFAIVSFILEKSRKNRIAETTLRTHF